MRVARWLFVALLAVAPSPASAVSVGTGHFFVDIDGNNNFTFSGSGTFDDRTYDVFGTDVNLGPSGGVTAVGTLAITGQLTGFDVSAAIGTFTAQQSSVTSNRRGADPTTGRVSCTTDNG